MRAAPGCLDDGFQGQHEVVIQGRTGATRSDPPQTAFSTARSDLLLCDQWAYD